MNVFNSPVGVFDGGDEFGAIELGDFLLYPRRLKSPQKQQMFQKYKENSDQVGFWISLTGTKVEFDDRDEEDEEEELEDEDFVFAEAPEIIRRLLKTIFEVGNSCAVAL